MTILGGNKMKINIMYLKTRKPQMLTITSVLIGILLTGCNSGNNSATGTTATAGIVDNVNISRDNQLATEVSVEPSLLTTASQISSKATSDSNCMVILPQNGTNIVTSYSGNQYYSPAQIKFTLQNKCSGYISLDGLTAILSGVNINSKSFISAGGAIKWIDQDQLNGAPWLNISSAASGNNITLNLTTPSCSGNYCDWAKMPPNSSKTITINTAVNSGINSFSVGSLTLNGITPPPVVESGSLQLTVDSSSLKSLCTTNSCTIGLDLISPASQKIASISLNPKESPVYTIKYNGLLIGNYTVSVNGSSLPNPQGGSISYKTEPATIPVSKNTTSNAKTTFSYTPAKILGSLTITNQNFPDSALFANIGALPGTVSSTSDNYPFTISLNGSVNISGLNTGNYAISVQGVADPLKGVYYKADPLSLSIVDSQNVAKSLTFSKLATSSLHKVTFSISNLPATATNVSFAGQNAGFKYNTDSLSNTEYWFANNESAIAVNITAPTGYTVSYSPQVITPATTNVSVSFQAISNNYLTTSNGQIVDSSGNIIKLKGINWFGFNNGGTMLDGLWSSDPLSGDFSTTVQRIKALGFNAVRLPFSFKDLAKSPNNFSHSNCPTATNAQLLANLTNPSVTPANGTSIPALSYAPTRGNNMCNDYLPNTSTMDRFIWIIDFFARNGFYVLIDDHLREDQTILNSGVSSWANQWKDLATRIKNGMPASSSSKVMFDLLNEPDNFGIRWEASGANPSLATAYLTAMDAISTVLPNNIYMVEGTGQSGINANWGDGFATNKTLISQSGLSDPNGFFTSVLSKPYVNQVVVSPHVYPPTVTNASSDYFGSGLYNRLNNSFGYLNYTGYCVNSNCHRFPVAIGEFGSRFTDNRDLQFFNSFASYLNNTNDANDGKHQPIYNWFYWSWNANSGDTGGVVDDSWKNINWNRIDYLSRGVLSGQTVSNPSGIGLQPWYIK